MPIFIFRGVEKSKVEEYFSKIEELSEIIDVDIKK
ncbi:DUF1904 family protein [Spiroplasma taiwanense]|uniref:Uncharacterized protein n=1 Tax=Spiroplasma taiwanense CT-1 TaxID=1276220 RepID=S5MAD9_9MOLU|nr:DUF1904 family protein [Spiroplasma taiwanense]AGR40713.1 hypothetical protein STAIW_v1c00160 [Spiroplasma taiwanense CT-1]